MWSNRDVRARLWHHFGIKNQKAINSIRFVAFPKVKVSNNMLPNRDKKNEQTGSQKGAKETKKEPTLIKRKNVRKHVSGPAN